MAGTTADERSMRERMLAGELHIADDPDLARDAGRAMRLTHRINPIDPTDGETLRQLLLPPRPHPTAAGPRRDKREAPLPIVIGDNVWLGGGVIVCPGVTIGANTVVGAGAVVIRDLPLDVVAAGNPARVVKAVQP